MCCVNPLCAHLIWQRSLDATNLAKSQSFLFLFTLVIELAMCVRLYVDKVYKCNKNIFCNKHPCFRFVVFVTYRGPVRLNNFNVDIFEARPTPAILGQLPHVANHIEELDLTCLS